MVIIATAAQNRINGFKESIRIVEKALADDKFQTDQKEYVEAQLAEAVKLAMHLGLDVKTGGGKTDKAPQTPEQQFVSELVKKVEDLLKKVNQEKDLFGSIQGMTLVHTRAEQDIDNKINQLKGTESEVQSAPAKLKLVEKPVKAILDQIGNDLKVESRIDRKEKLLFRRFVHVVQRLEAIVAEADKLVEDYGEFENAPRKVELQVPIQTLRDFIEEQKGAERLIAVLGKHIDTRIQQDEAIKEFVNAHKGDARLFKDANYFLTQMQEIIGQLETTVGSVRALEVDIIRTTQAEAQTLEKAQEILVELENELNAIVGKPKKGFLRRVFGGGGEPEATPAGEPATPVEPVEEEEVRQPLNEPTAEGT